MAQQISIDEAWKVITTKNLVPIGGLWHYSFNVEHFFPYMLLKEKDGATFLYAPGAINQWAPLPVFTDALISLPDRMAGRNPFWFCRLSTFNDFLDRRSALSRNPRKHFPTRQTFQKKDVKLQGQLFVNDLNENSFREIYERLRRPEHLNASETLNVFYRSNVSTPRHWFKMITLSIGGSIVGIGLIVDDGRSQSLVNLASVIDSNRLGLYMLTLWIQDCCFSSKQSVDAGISGTYGIYKDQLFLDSKVINWEAV